MAEKKKGTAPKAKAAKKATPKPLVAESKVGKLITVKVGETEYRGLCTTERGTNSGAQVYLRLNGLVSRFFNTSDIVKVEEVE